MTDNKKQHYIPQCYLRNFSKNRKAIFVYNKLLSKSYQSSIGKIGYINNLYEIPEKFIDDIKNVPHGKLYYEKQFFAENVESLFDVILKKITEKAHQWKQSFNKEEILDLEEKELFAQLIAIQYLRMPNIRDQFGDGIKKKTEYTLDLLKSFIVSQNPKLKKEAENIIMGYDSDYNAVVHSEMYADQELIQDIAALILDKHWIYYISEESDLFTSDNPIIIKPHLNNQTWLYHGFGMIGSEIIFPLSSSVLLTLWDSKAFLDQHNQANTFQKISDKEIRAYNSLQYIWANLQVYSERDNFLIIDYLKIANDGQEKFMRRPSIKVNGM